MIRRLTSQRLVEDLAREYCEHLTTIEGCLDGRTREDRWCTPCKARHALGITSAPRRCENCGAEVGYDGIDTSGGRDCPPKPHRPHRFYHEFGKVGER